jgi:hypothetical protein
MWRSRANRRQNGDDNILGKDTAYNRADIYPARRQDIVDGDKSGHTFVQCHPVEPLLFGIWHLPFGGIDVQRR